MSAHAEEHAVDDHGHHHKETFVTKYIFSTDHKMISKQYLITGLFMGIIGIAMSILMRMQLAWPEEPFVIFEMLLGKWAEGGVMDPSVYLALVTIHGTIMVFFVLTAGLSGTFSNLLIPLQIGARDMASGFLNMVSYWLFFLSSLIMVMSLFVEAGPASAGWTIYPPLSALPQAIPGSGAGMTLWLVSMAIFIASSLLGVFKLCGNGYKPKNKRNAYDASSSYYMGVLCNSYYWYCIFSCAFICSAYAYYG